MKKIITSLAVIPFLVTSCGEKENLVTSKTFKNDISSCYSLMPTSFADGNGDGHGDLIGVTDSLDYLANDLGIQCIWMTPIHQSGSYHKYDVDDYKSIDPSYGTMEDYENLLTKAENLGIKVLLDLVVNHTSKRNEWFSKAMSGDSKYEAYYNIKDISDKDKYPNRGGWYPAYGNKHYYASFWDGMPELDMDNQAVRDEFKNIAKFWLDKGVDGFRIDAAKHIYDLNEYPVGTPTLAKNIDFFKEFTSAVKNHKSDAFIVNEVYDSTSMTSHFFEAVDSNFNFDNAGNILGSVNGARDIASKNLRYIRDDIAKVDDTFIDSIFITNHDQDRTASVLSNDESKVKLAANILLSQPGLPFIYYGEELGMTGSGKHESVRQPFKWTDTPNTGKNVNGPKARVHSWDARNTARDSLETQMKDENSVFSTYKNAIKVRKEYHDFFAKGEYKEINFVNTWNTSYELTFGDKKLMVMHNLWNTEKEVNLSIEPTLVSSLTSGSSVTGKTIKLPGRASIIVEVPTDAVVA